MARENTIRCVIHQVYGFLNDEETVVYARVSWGDRKPQDEVRKCWRNQAGELQLGKGLALSTKMIRKLKSISEETTDIQGVDFDSVFRSSEGIMEKREAGFKTEDGFYVLRRKTIPKK